MTEKTQLNSREADTRFRLKKTKMADLIPGGVLNA